MLCAHVHVCVYCMSAYNYIEVYDPEQIHVYMYMYVHVLYVCIVCLHIIILRYMILNKYMYTCMYMYCMSAYNYIKVYDPEQIQLV